MRTYRGLLNYMAEQNPEYAGVYRGMALRASQGMLDSRVDNQGNFININEQGFASSIPIGIHAQLVGSQLGALVAGLNQPVGIAAHSAKEGEPVWVHLLQGVLPDMDLSVKRTTGEKPPSECKPKFRAKARHRGKVW